MCGGIVDPGLPGFPYKPALPSNGIFTGIKYSHPFLNGSIGSFFLNHIHSLFNSTLRKLFAVYHNWLYTDLIPL